MGTMIELGSDRTRGFTLASHCLESRAEREGVEAETVRELVIVGLARGETLSALAARLSAEFMIDWARARSLVQLAYVGS
jgi:hypothetical protein